jgi:hypothetical protein
MAKQLRLIGPHAIVLLVALAVVLPRTEWARHLGLPGNLGTGPVKEQDAQALQEQNAEATLKAIQRRIAAKELIVKNLIDGRITLFEAAALFRDLNHAYPELPSVDAPGDSEEEKLCQQVLRWVKMVLETAEPTDRDILAHLEEELRRHKQQNGKVILQYPERGA